MSKKGLFLGVAAALLMLVLPAPKNAPIEIPETTEVALLSVETLNKLVLSGDQSLLVLDLRSEEAFLKQSIKTALSMPTPTLDPEKMQALPVHRRLVLYAEDTEQAVVVWQQVQAYRPNALVLEGGFAAWNEQVLHPQAPDDNASQDQWDAYNEQVAVANFYLGKIEGAAPVQRKRTITPTLRPRGTGQADEGC